MRKPFRFRLDPEVLPLGVKVTWGKMSLQEHNRKIKTAEEKLWESFCTFSVYRTVEGGPGQRGAINDLKAMGIPARPGYSPYVGQQGVQVPTRYRKRAEQLLYWF